MDSRRCLQSARTRIMASEDSETISVTDVYEQAAGIAHEFDKLIHNFGSEAVTELMPRVIRSLEYLESLACRYERDVSEISTLKFKVDKLEAEKIERAHERAKFDQDLENIEDNWQVEVKELLNVVGRLQEENKRLKENVKNEKYAAAAEIVARRQETEEEEIKVLSKLKETVDKQREELRCMRRELSQKTVDCEALQAQLQRIAKINADLRLKNSTQKKQTRILLQEKLELESQLQDKDGEVEHIKRLINDQEKYDEQRAAVQAVIAAESQGDVLDSASIGQQLAEAKMASSPSEPEPQPKLVPAFTHPLQDLENKLVVDIKDPDRPRFSLEELKQVLVERNDLKTRLIEVEEELSFYKPNEDSDDSQVDSGIELKSSYAGEEVLVYGPINREPDEKLGRRKESGIRKFFNFLFTDGPSQM